MYNANNTENEHSQTEKFCRICAENETSGEMLYEPCACTGSIGQVVIMT